MDFLFDNEIVSKVHSCKIVKSRFIIFLTYNRVIKNPFVSPRMCSCISHMVSSLHVVEDSVKGMSN